MFQFIVRLPVVWIGAVSSARGTSLRFPTLAGLLQTEDVVDALHKADNNGLPGHQVAKPI